MGTTWRRAIRTAVLATLALAGSLALDSAAGADSGGGTAPDVLMCPSDSRQCSTEAIAGATILDVIQCPQNQAGCPRGAIAGGAVTTATLCPSGLPGCPAEQARPAVLRCPSGASCPEAPGG